jgi:hypothetical protein
LNQPEEYDLNDLMDWVAHDAQILAADRFIATAGDPYIYIQLLAPIVVEKNYLIRLEYRLRNLYNTTPGLEELITKLGLDEG